MRIISTLKMNVYKFILFAALCGLFQPFVVDATNILVVGDSMGAIMGTYLENLCSGSTVCNAAISGTTASQWASYSSKKVSKCSGTWDVVYISVGGNDSLKSGCTLSSDVLGSYIQSAVTNIKTNIAPGATKYLLTGYCIPYTSPNSGCADPSDIMVMSDALAIIDTSDGTVEVIDSYDVCGGSENSWSNQFFFHDSIHLNQYGYYTMFTQKEVQESMMCSNDGNGNKDNGEKEAYYSTELSGYEGKSKNDSKIGNKSSRGLMGVLVVACLAVVILVGHRWNKRTVDNESNDYDQSTTDYVKQTV